MASELNTKTIEKIMERMRKERNRKRILAEREKKEPINYKERIWEKFYSITAGSLHIRMLAKTFSFDQKLGKEEAQALRGILLPKIIPAPRIGGGFIITGLGQNLLKLMKSSGKQRAISILIKWKNYYQKIGTEAKKTKKIKGFDDRTRLSAFDAFLSALNDPQIMRQIIAEEFKMQENNLEFIKSYQEIPKETREKAIKATATARKETINLFNELYPDRAIIRVITPQKRDTN